jgi:hypothetical protein
MIRFQEEHHLCKMTAFTDGGAEKAAYQFTIDDWTRKINVSFRDASAEDIAKLFLKAKVRDNASEPRSRKGATYRQMVDDILSGVDRISWIWSNHLQIFLSTAKEMGAIVSGGIREAARPKPMSLNDIIF